MTVRLHIAMDTFEVEVGPATVDVSRGSTARPDVTITASVAVLREIMFTDRTLESAIEAGDLDLSGDAAAAAHFFTLFRPPD